MFMKQQNFAHVEHGNKGIKIFHKLPRNNACLLSCMRLLGYCICTQSYVDCRQKEDETKHVVIQGLGV